MPATTSTSYSISTKKPKRKIEYGSTIKFLNIINCILTLVLFFSSFERLEWLADKPLIDLHTYLPYSLLKLSILIDSYSQPLVYMGLLLHLLAMKLSTTQAIMTELLNYLAWPTLFVLNLSPFQSNEDRLVYRMIFNAIAFILATSNLILKRKVKNVKQSNNGPSNAFSTVSTPSLQVNNNSNGIVPQGGNVWQPPINKVMTQTDYSQWIDNDEDMDTSSNLDFLPDPIRERRSVSREITPFTEISGRLSSLSLNFGKETHESPLKLSFRPPKSQAPKILSEAAITPSFQKIRSPFSSLKFHANSKQTTNLSSQQPTWTQSTFSARSPINSNILQPKTSPSLFSSVSSQSNGSVYNLRHRPTPPPSIKNQPIIGSLQNKALRPTPGSISTTSLKNGEQKRSVFRKLFNVIFRVLLIVIILLVVRAFFFENNLQV